MLQLFDAIGKHAARNSAAPAICGTTHVLSFSELANVIARLCVCFDDNGLAPGMKVYVNIRDGDLRLIVHLACIHFGAVPFMVHTPDQVPGQVDHQAVIGAGDPIDPKLDDTFEITERIFAPGTMPLSVWGGHPRADSDLLLVATTSGTTGLWKLIAETVGHFSFQIDKSHDFGIGDRVAIMMGELALINFRTVARALYSGATIVRASLEPLVCLKQINLFVINKLILAPKTLERLMDAMEGHSIECPSLKSITVSGSLFTRQLLERAETMFDAEFVVLYGSAEVGGIASARVESGDFDAGFVGTIRPYLELRIDAETDGEPGRIVLRNDPVLIQRYYENGSAVPDDAAEYVMPDIGIVRDGLLYLSGRDDEVYNYSGNKIAFSEMVDHLMAEEAVKDVAIVRVPDDPDPFALKIAIVAVQDIDLLRLRETLCERLGRRGLQEHLELRAVNRIPRNASGKIDREPIVGLFSGN